MNIERLTEFLRLGVDDGDVVHIYDDGLVLVIACSAERHRLILETCRDFGDVIDGRSSDGFAGVFVVGSLLLAGVPLNKLPPIVGIPPSYADHRQDDYHTLADAEALAERYFRATSQGDST